MNQKEYLVKRKQLMDEAQQFINEKDAEKAQKKMQAVADLDKQWNEIAQAEANFKALNSESLGIPPYDMKDIMKAGEGTSANNVEVAWDSEEYKSAWAKTLLGQPLSNEENDKFKMVNEAFTHNTENTGIVIPKTVARGIWEMAGEMYPYFAKVAKTYVNGILSMIKEDTSSDAKWYDENTKTEDGKETFKEFTLNGCELSRNITVSWKLKEMGIEDFIPYIQRKMAKKMGAAAGYGVTHGKGPDKEGKKHEPTGVVTALKAETDTPQVVTYTAGTVPTYTDIITTRSKIKSGYGAGLSIYANSNTIWTKLAAIVDANKRPLFVADPTTAGAFRILGMLIEEDDSMSDGEILLSNAEDGYHLNINKEMSVLTEDHVKERTTDYCGYAIMDGNVVTTRAHALLCEKTA